MLQRRYCSLTVTDDRQCAIALLLSHAHTEADDAKGVTMPTWQNAADCKKPKKKQNQKSGDDGDFVNLAEDIGDSLILSVDSPIESWILDSGASFHSSPSKELFQNFKCGNFGKVYLADNKALVIEGKGFWDDKNRTILRHCDVTFDESIMYKDGVQKVSETTKQVGVEVELEKSTPIDVEVETQPTPDIVDKEPEVEQVTPEQVLRKSSRTIRAPDRYSPSLHYLLLTDEGEPESVDEAIQMLRCGEDIDDVGNF
ncbi:unnamed protein product [Cuscuta campestris]|uniref:Retrovirus-related Pol polyprotein from transposon TNT 1-94-like beta-barrel domain-containing protein n=1 Tax=Cuscuta campestris TaxID=132261 RepID=A0A484KXZ0_9ASTE|nr:unnamed protein product [Cuscuta campestris]